MSVAAVPTALATVVAPAQLSLARLHGADADGARGLPLGAVKNVTLVLRPGIHAFVGTPSDGTAALVALIAGQVRPRIGHVELLGGDPFDDPAIRRRLGVLPYHACLPHGRDVAQALAMAAALRDVDAALMPASLERIAALSLMPRAISSLSREEARAVELSVALAPELPVLALFEPFREVAPADASRVRERIAERADAGACVIVATRHGDDVVGWADHIHLLDGGALRGSDDTIGWPRVGAGELLAWIEADDEACAALMTALAPDARDVAWRRQSATRALLRIACDDLAATALALADAIAAQGIVLVAVRPGAPSLSALRQHARYRQRALLERVDPAPPAVTPPAVTPPSETASAEAVPGGDP